MKFEIIFEDEHYIAINKPCGILVHRTKISEDTVFVLQLLRDQIQQRIYPIHRLDRATSGVLIFGKDKESASLLGQLFMDKNIDKEYIAIIRGFVEEEASIDYPLTNVLTQVKQDAITHYKRQQQSELDFEVNRYPTSRYSLVSIKTETGRRHQIRRHFAHLRHPIIGDKKHGDCKHNKYFQENFNLSRMLLHAQQLQFTHPFSNEAIQIIAPIDEKFKRAKTILKL